MRQIECQRSDCGQQTFLIDETVTLDKGWSAGAEPGGMPYYVCPYHRQVYVLTPMPSAIITKPEPEMASDAVPQDSEG